MAKQFIFIILIIFAIVSCEEVYRPGLDVVDDFLVVEAVLISNHIQNEIKLYKTIGFNKEIREYPRASGASVFLVDNNNYRIKCSETDEGTYLLDHEFDPNGAYYLYIEYNGEVYQSEIQTLPDMPVFDSMYLGYTTRVLVQGASNSSDKIIKEDGIQIYVDIEDKGDLTYYRFSSRKVIQYIDYVDSIFPLVPIPIPIAHYTWKSKYPTGIFNIAGPPSYSTVKDITKHPIEFFEKNYNKYIPYTSRFEGYIYFLYQYGLNEDTYSFYSDLSSQMDAEGKIFDPVYIQAEGNISCVSDPEKVVLGNFEISSMTEKRYYLNYYKTDDSIRLFRSIPYFYDIPEEGSTIDIQPDFWESRYKEYPDK